jgi:hypothetical protein
VIHLVLPHQALGSVPAYLRFPLFLLFFAELIAAIWTALKWITDKAITIGLAVWRAFKFSAKYTWKGLKWLGKEAKTGLEWLKTEAKEFARWWKDQAAPWLRRALDNIDTWFHKHFGWLITWVHRIQSILGWVYKFVLRPLLQFLEISRAILRLLAALHVPFAAKLEKILGKVEFWLESKWLELQRFVNDIASVLDVILDPWGYFSRNAFGWSVWRWMRDVQILMRLADIGRKDPVPDALRLAAGSDPLDIPVKGNELRHDLDNPPEWVVESGALLRGLLD